ncbi:MAG TPA: hypothetical protein VGB70_02170 [Allosphingosinicella sp.]
MFDDSLPKARNFRHPFSKTVAAELLPLHNGGDVAGLAAGPGRLADFAPLRWRDFLKQMLTKAWST